MKQPAASPRQASERPPSHAGGIVARLDAGPPRYLLVRARRDPTQWVFPKGHVEPGESPEAAAVREVREEAGVRARIVEPLDRIALRDGEVLLYLMRYEADVEATEDREVAWCEAEEAQRRLRFPEFRAVLSRAHGRIRQLGPGPDEAPRR